MKHVLQIHIKVINDTRMETQFYKILPVTGEEADGIVGL